MIVPALPGTGSVVCVYVCMYECLYECLYVCVCVCVLQENDRKPKSKASRGYITTDTCSYYELRIT